MCTLVILRRPGHAWPLLVAGNRDEMSGRTWSAPGRHWPDRPEVTAGIDRVGGGSWFGINDHGLVAVVTNREGSLGPAQHKRSRGELVLEALDHAEASEAASALAESDPDAYRGFNLFVGDAVTGHWLCHRDDGLGKIASQPVAPGLHMLTARDLDDVSAPRISAYRPQFAQATVPDPTAGDWQAWQALLGSREIPGGAGDPATAPNFALVNGFGTVCSQLAAIPRYPSAASKPVFLFAAGPPDSAPFEAVGV